VGVAMLTPSSSGGGLGQIYMLNRGGANAGSAIAISFITFLGSMVALLCLGLYNLLFSGFSDMGLLLRTAVWGFTLIAVFVILAAVWPGLFRVLIMLIYQAYWQIRGKNHRLGVFRSPPEAQDESSQASVGRVAAKLVHMTHTYQDNVRRFVRRGKGSFVIVCLLSLGFLLSRCLMAFLCLRSHTPCLLSPHARRVRTGRRRLSFIHVQRCTRRICPLLQLVVAIHNTIPGSICGPLLPLPHNGIRCSQGCHSPTW
jgi:uncharacterized membrane protein YbhN (UPF0104 family)